jgi:hypothetical protein
MKTKLTLDIDDQIVARAKKESAKRKLSLSELVESYLNRLVKNFEYENKGETLSYSLEQFKDIEDGLLYFLALKADMQYFITRNIKDFQSSSPSLPVLTPSQYLKEIYLNDLSQ